MSEYIKKEEIAEEVKTLEDFWRKKWKDHDSTANFEDAHIAKAVMNAFKYLGLFLSDLPTYSFPESKEMKQLYSDLLRVKHDTMNIDSLIDKVYADMRGKDNDTV